MTTAGTLITASLQQLRVYAASETPNDADMALGLQQLNLLLDTLSNDAAACFAILTQSLPMVAGKQTYTIGPGGDLSGIRPLRLIYGPGAAYLIDANNVTVSVDVWPQDRWNDIGYKAENADYPSVIFYDPQFPLANLNVFPIPTLSYTLYFTSYSQLGDLSGYTTTINLPPGYQAMLQSNLSVCLKPFYKNAALDPDIQRMAMRTLAAVKRTNRRQNYADYDVELMQRGSGSYDIYSDSYRT